MKGPVHREQRRRERPPRRLRRRLPLFKGENVLIYLRASFSPLTLLVTCFLTQRVNSVGGIPSVNVMLTGEF
jgi:hypothetical protein